MTVTPQNHSNAINAIKITAHKLHIFKETPMSVAKILGHFMDRARKTLTSSQADYGLVCLWSMYLNSTLSGNQQNTGSSD